MEWKQSLFLSALIALFFLSNIEAVEETTSPSSLCVKGFAIGGSWLYMKPTITDLNYARVLVVEEVTGPGLHGDNIVGHVKAIKPHHSSGFETFASYQSGAGWGLRSQYRYLASEDTEKTHVQDPSQVLMGVGFMTDIDHDRFHRANGEVSTKHYAIDVDGGWSFNLNSAWRIRLFGGIEYGKIDHTLKVHYSDVLDPGIAGFTKVKNWSTYSGTGPRLGVSSFWNIWQGLGFSAQFATNFLVGQKKGGISETGFDDQSGAETFDLQWDDHFPSQVRVVPLFDLSLGARYQESFRGIDLALEVGYRVLHALSAIDQYKIAGNDQGDGEDTSKRMEHSTIWQHTSDFGLHGIYLQASIGY